MAVASPEEIEEAGCKNAVFVDPVDNDDLPDITEPDEDCYHTFPDDVPFCGVDK
jgi:hypothetical protein